MCSAVVVALVATLPATTWGLLTRSVAVFVAVVAGAAITGWRRPFLRGTGAARDVIVTWGLWGAATVSLLDTLFREVVVAQAGGWYFPRLDQPLVYAVVIGIGMVVEAVLLWVPMAVLAFIGATLQAHLGSPSDRA
jgi:hypothetical protein